MLHLSFIQITKLQHGSPASCLQGVSAPPWIFLRVHQGLGIQCWNVDQKEPKCSTNLECWEWNWNRGQVKTFVLKGDSLVRDKCKHAGMQRHMEEIVLVAERCFQSFTAILMWHENSCKSNTPSNKSNTGLLPTAEVLLQDWTKFTREHVVV